MLVVLVATIHDSIKTPKHCAKTENNLSSTQYDQGATHSTSRCYYSVPRETPLPKLFVRALGGCVVRWGLYRYGNDRQAQLCIVASFCILMCARLSCAKTRQSKTSVRWPKQPFVCLHVCFVSIACTMRR